MITKPEVKLNEKNGNKGATPPSLTEAINIDADVLEWFKARDEEYERLINAVLRKYVQLHKQELL